MADLRSIVYLSEAAVEMTATRLEALLVDAREFNRRTAVTGILLYGDGRFMQCFEGAEESVAEVYARIKASRQHRAIVELLASRVDSRCFPDWQMGFARPTPSALLALSSARWENRRRFEDGAKATSPGLALLRNFWTETLARA
jgi:hypothetical protein